MKISRVETTAQFITFTLDTGVSFWRTERARKHAATEKLVRAHVDSGGPFRIGYGKFKLLAHDNRDMVIAEFDTDAQDGRDYFGTPDSSTAQHAQALISKAKAYAAMDRRKEQKADAILAKGEQPTRESVSGQWARYNGQVNGIGKVYMAIDTGADIRDLRDSDVPHETRQRVINNVLTTWKDETNIVEPDYAESEPYEPASFHNSIMKSAMKLAAREAKQNGQHADGVIGEIYNIMSDAYDERAYKRERKAHLDSINPNSKQNAAAPVEPVTLVVNFDAERIVYEHGLKGAGLMEILAITNALHIHGADVNLVILAAK